eukprot:EG_transcript_12660
MASPPAPCLAASPADWRFAVDVDRAIPSAFDAALRAEWAARQAAGFFRFAWAAPRSRVAEGTYRFLLQFNPLRAVTRRPPQSMSAVVQPVDPNVFNFNKADHKKELLYEVQFSSPVDPDKNAVVADDVAIQGPTLGRDVLLINVSPIEFGHTLLVPEMEACHPQVLDCRSICLAVQCILVSGLPELKAAFNGLCAHASVNHRHWHLYYLGGHRLPLETLPTQPLDGAGRCHELRPPTYPAPCLVFQVASATQLGEVCRDVFRVVELLQQADVAHNVFLTRGAPLGECIGATNTYSVVRIFVWAREKVAGAKDPAAFSVAVCELSGQVLLYQPADFERVTEAEVAAAFRATCCATFEAVRPRVRELFV